MNNITITYIAQLIQFFVDKLNEKFKNNDQSTIKKITSINEDKYD